MPAPRKPDPLLLVALAAVAQATRFTADRYAIDDAWISFRIARNLVQGQGLTYDPSLPPVEGMTNLLWTLVAAGSLAVAPDLAPTVSMRALGAACFVGLVVLAAATARRLARAAGADGRLAALATGLLLASAGNLAFHSMSGLETGAWALAWALVAWLLAAPSPPPAAAMGGALALLVLHRPEGVLGGGLALVALTGLHRRLPVGPALAFLGVVGGVTAFRLWTYGDVVPNTFHAKPPDGGLGWPYLGRFLLVGLGGLGPLALVPALRRLPAARALVAIAGVLCVGVAWSGGDWMPGHRRLAEVLVLLAIPAGVGLALSVERREVEQQAATAGRRRGPLVLSLVGLMAWTGSAVYQAGTRGDHRAYGLSTFAEVGALLDRSPPVHTVASADIGALGWAYRRSVFDLAGLTDTRLARAGGFDPAWFDARAPEVLLVAALAPVPADLSDPPGLRRFEAPMLAHLRARGGYHVHDAVPSVAGGVLSVLVRDDVRLPAELWGPPAD